MGNLITNHQYTLMCHQVYELNKGVRHLVLLTMEKSLQASVECYLQEHYPSYHIEPLSTQRFNVAIGAPCMVRLAAQFLQKGLNALSHEEDFILGTMLGYSCIQQVQRYLKRTQATPSHQETAIQWNPASV